MKRSSSCARRRTIAFISSLPILLFRVPLKFPNAGVDILDFDVPATLDLAVINTCFTAAVALVRMLRYLRRRSAD
jgi:hypothetical protein